MVVCWLSLIIGCSLLISLYPLWYLVFAAYCELFIKYRLLSIVYDAWLACCLLWIVCWVYSFFTIYDALVGCWLLLIAYWFLFTMNGLFVDAVNCLLTHVYGSSAAAYVCTWFCLFIVLQLLHYCLLIILSCISFIVSW